VLNTRWKFKKNKKKKLEGKDRRFIIPNPEPLKEDTKPMESILNEKVGGIEWISAPSFDGGYLWWPEKWCR